MALESLKTFTFSVPPPQTATLLRIQSNTKSNAPEVDHQMIKSRVLLASEPMILAWFASLYIVLYVQCACMLFILFDSQRIFRYDCNRKNSDFHLKLLYQVFFFSNKS